MNVRHSTAQRGFTLIELIVAIGVFAVMAAMAYGGLSSVLNTRASVQRSLARTAVYQKAYIRLRDDFSNAAARAARDDNGTEQPALIYDRYRQRVEFSRGGRPNPLGLPRTGFERVSYGRQENGELVRESWSAIDRAPRAEPVRLTVLDGVDKLQWRFLDSRLQWHEQWPPENGGFTGPIPTGPGANGQPPLPPAPRAVELVLDTRDWGRLRLLFELGPEPATIAPGGNGNGNGGTTGGSGGGTGGGAPPPPGA